MTLQERALTARRLRPGMFLAPACALSLLACNPAPPADGPPVTAPAAVITGTPIKWRLLTELATPSAPDVDPNNADWQPRHELVVGRFDKTAGDDLLLIDFKKGGEARIYQPGGKHSVVKGASYMGITRYHAWDFDRDGIDDLIPQGVAWAFYPLYAKISVNIMGGG
jgi:hypothetical protein